LSSSLQIRPATPDDVELIFSLIVELAEYERAADQVRGDPELLTEALFGEHPVAEALIAERHGGPIGFALFYVTFSTWECRPGLWLEDLYVPPEHRRGGVGRALLSAVAAIALARGCSRLEWTALDWNEPALGFYEKLSARRLDDWVTHRLDGALLEAAARGPGGGPSPAPAGNE
jgi:GNAT superfamily N-acetyltransferase